MWRALEAVFAFVIAAVITNGFLFLVAPLILVIGIGNAVDKLRLFLKNMRSVNCDVPFYNGYC